MRIFYLRNCYLKNLILFSHLYTKSSNNLRYFIMFRSHQEIKIEPEPVNGSDSDSTLQSSVTHSQTDSQVHHKARTLPSWLAVKCTPGNGASEPLFHITNVKQETESHNGETSSLPSHCNVEIKKEFNFCADQITIHDSFHIKQVPGVSNAINEDQRDSCAETINNSFPKSDDTASFVSSVKAGPIGIPNSASDQVVPQQSQGSALTLDSDSHNNITSTDTTRSACRYGSRCYRRSAQHKTDFSHPGDADFVDNTDCDSTTDASAKQKPACLYGSRCYRRNEAHKRQFYHPPHSQTRTERNRTNRDNYSCGSDNSDEYESSFIDDSSTDDFEMSESESEHGFSDFEEESSSEEESKRTKGKAKKMKKDTFSLF